MDTIIKAITIPLIILILIGGLIYILPTCQSMPSGFLGAISTIADAYSDWNAIIALAELWFVLKLVMGIEFALILFSIANWAYNKIRFH